MEQLVRGRPDSTTLNTASRRFSYVERADDFLGVARSNAERHRTSGETSNRQILSDTKATYSAALNAIAKSQANITRPNENAEKAMSTDDNSYEETTTDALIEAGYDVPPVEERMMGNTSEKDARQRAFHEDILSQHGSYAEYGKRLRSLLRKNSTQKKRVTGDDDGMLDGDTPQE